MACFLVSAAEAVVTTVAAKVIEKKEKEQPELNVSFDGATVESVTKIPFSRKLKWLSRMLWGGSVLLMFEHLARRGCAVLPVSHCRRQPGGRRRDAA